MPTTASRERTVLPYALALGLVFLLGASRAGAGPGSGAAAIAPSTSVPAGSNGTWSITYTAAEDFAIATGGTITIEIPAGWTAPQNLDPGAPGYVEAESALFLDSLTVSAQNVRLRLGTPPLPQFLVGDSLRLVYGSGGGPAAATAQTLAPGDATFFVSSDPEDTGSQAEIASSPSLSVVPDTVSYVRIVDPAMAPLGALGLTADDDTTRLFLLGYDRFDNSARLIDGSWSVTGGIGLPAPSFGTETVLTLGTVGTGYAVGDSGAWADSTGLITVSHGAYTGLSITADGTATAGIPFSAGIDAVDTDGNTVTSGPGSSATIVISSYADSLGAAPADPSLVSDAATLASGAWSAALTARRAGIFWLAAHDTITGIESSPRARLVVTPASTDHIVLQPDTLRLESGTPGAATLLAFDAFENRAPTAAGETLTLWTDRAAGRFTDRFGAPIYEVTIAAGSDSVDFRFIDTQAGAGVGRVRAIDANGIPPFVGLATSWVVTAPGPPFGAVALVAAPSTMVADGADSSHVTSGPIFDSSGNVVAAGEQFTVSGVLMTPSNDVNSGTPGVQWTTTAGGTVDGWVRAGVVKGSGSVALASERGSGSGSVPIDLIAGLPTGALALTVDPDSLSADSVATLSVTAAGLSDANGNEVEDGEGYTVATTLGAMASPDADAGAPGTQVLAALGAISFVLFGGDSLGIANVTAASVRGSASGSTNVRLVPGLVSASRSSLAAVTPVPVGPAGSVVTVTLRDAQGHALPGVPADSISVAVTGVPAIVVPLQTATDSTGTIEFRGTATLAATGVLSSTARGVELDDSPIVVFQPGPLDHYAISGPAGPLTAGAADALQIEARDSFENSIPALAGIVLRPTLIGGGAILPDSVTISGGIAAIPFTPTAASPLTIRVSDDASRTVTYGPVPVVAGAPYRLIALAPPASTLAAGDSVAVAARVHDAYGNVVALGQVLASIVAGGGSVAPPSESTDFAGLAGFTLHAGPAPGVLTLKLIAGGSAAPDSIRADSIVVTVIPAVAASLRILPDSLTWVAGAPVRVRVQPLDVFGNVVVADTATVVMGPSGAVEWSPEFGVPAGGEFVTFGSDTLAETVAIGADRTGGGSGSGGLAVVGPSAPAAVVIVSGNGQTAVADREVPAPLRVSVRDAYGNAVPGASVVYRVTLGNGSLDAVRGGVPDSVAVADAAGIAACDVVRLGTVAGAALDGALARLLAAPAAQVLFTSSALPDTATSLALTPPSISLGASGIATVTATARDQFGNLAPGTAVTYFLGAPALGTLESLGSTSGGPGSQSGWTAASGTIDVRYRAPSSAPAADSIFARGTSIVPVGIRASVAAAATAALRIVPDSLSWVAGDPVRVRVQAVDAFGNPVPADVASVVMRPSGSAVWSPPSGPMVGGEFVTFASDTLAETLASLAADRAGGGTGSAGPVTVRPAAPAGPIAIAASRDTLTADGRSASAVTLGPVRDAYGNKVPTGTLVLVAAQAATLLAADASPLPGLDLSTAADGSAPLVLIAPSTQGPDTLRVTSRVGTASGLRPFTYEPPPSLAYVSGSLAPQIVAPGSAYAFRVRVRNTGPGTIRIDAGTVITFGAGATAYSAPLDAMLTLPSGASDMLRFATVSVSSLLTPGAYAPTLRAVGTDGTGEAFDFYLNLAGAQVNVAGVDVAAVGATPSPVPLGYADLALTFDVSNPSAQGATIDAASLAYSTGAFTTNAVIPALPTPLPANGTTRLTVSVRVPSGGITAGTIVNATLTATVTFAGSSVAGSNTAPLSFQVVSAAQIAAVAGGASPSRYLRARTYGPTARVSNTGNSTVNLSRGGTRLVLEHPGGDLLSVGLGAATVVAGGDVATLAFDSLAVPAAVARGRYAARLVLSGTEAGLAFADTIPLDPDSVSVLEPPLLAVQGAPVPGTVSAGQTRPLRLTLSNGGGVPFDVDPATTLRLGVPLSADLTLLSAATVGPGAAVTFEFSGAPLGSALSPGIASATLEARGLEDGTFRSETLNAGVLDARIPASLLFVAGSANPDTVRAGQSFDLTVAVQNGGGSPFTLDPATSRLILTDGVEQVVALGAGAPISLGPGGQSTLSFPSAAFPAAFASQPYPILLLLQGIEWGLAESSAVVSPPGEIIVREPAAAIQVRALDAGTPIQVSAGASAVKTWGLEVTPLVPTGGVTSAHLTQLRITVLTDGSPAGAPSTALTSITLRNPTGALLAQAAAGAGNPIDLALSTPLALSSRAESLTVEVAISGATLNQSIALRLAAESDIVALDDLTLTPVPVRSGGGLAFVPLTSPALTLFARAHGYPNPFRAGREAVLLSYLLAQDASVRVTIYTLLGDVVRELSLTAGTMGGTRGLNEVAWDGRNGRGDLVRPGVYVARIEGAGTNENIKVGVLR